MTHPIVITPRIIDIVRSLPEIERNSVINALARHLFLDENEQLAGTSARVVYALIKSSIARDSRRMSNDRGSSLGVSLG